MMREHMGLYRGKRIDNGEWVEGFYHRVTNNWTHENVHYITCFQDMPLTGETILTVQHEVDPATIGECTSLKDKNGKLIFEGDVVRVYGDDLPHWMGAGEIRVVKYDHDGYTPFSEYDSDCGEYVRAKDCEIIGNVADSPELLKGGEGDGTP